MTTGYDEWLRAARIVVLGGGPAGLAVARLLRQRGITAEVLERDTGPYARSQGGSLDLSERGGQRALREMGLSGRFTELARPAGQRLCVMDPDGTIRFDSPDHRDEYRPEIDRVQLRRLLLDALPESAITWGATVESVTPLAARGHRVDLADGRTREADLVLACDGIGSAARSLVTDDRPRYSGITFVHGDVTHPPAGSFLARHTGAGAMHALGDNRAILSQRGADGSIRIYFALRTQEDPATARGEPLRDDVRDHLRDAFAGWATELLGIIDEIDTGFTYWPLHSMPPRQRWRPHSGVTLLGDAAHVMPPFSGEGVNLALLDAVELVKSLTAPGTTSLDQAIARYEAAMLTRMAPAITESTAGGDLILNPKGTGPLVDVLTG